MNAADKRTPMQRAETERTIQDYLGLNEAEARQSKAHSECPGCALGIAHANVEAKDRESIDRVCRTEFRFNGRRLIVDHGDHVAAILKLNKRKVELLQHYAERQPTRFVQFDGFSGDNGGISGSTDSNGDEINTSETWELMTGAPTIRLLVSERATPREVIRLCDKIAEYVGRKGFLEEMRRQSDARLLPQTVGDDDLPF